MFTGRAASYATASVISPEIERIIRNNQLIIQLVFPYWVNAIIKRVIQFNDWVTQNSPRMRRTFDGFLTILPPRILIRWNISHLHAYSSHSNNSLNPCFPISNQISKYQSMNKIFILILNIIFFAFNFFEGLKFNLFLGQWQRSAEDPPPHLVFVSSIELHFLLNDDVDSGGRPAEIWNPDDIEGWRLSVSPVNDEINELAGEAKLIVVDDSFLSIDPFLTGGRGGNFWIGVGR